MEHLSLDLTWKVKGISSLVLTCSAVHKDWYLAMINLLSGLAFTSVDIIVGLLDVPNEHVPGYGTESLGVLT